MGPRRCHASGKYVTLPALEVYFREYVDYKYDFGRMQKESSEEEL